MTARQRPYQGGSPPSGARQERAWPTEGRLGRAGDPVEGRNLEVLWEPGETGGVNVSDHLGPAGDPVEGPE